MAAFSFRESSLLKTKMDRLQYEQVQKVYEDAHKEITDKLNALPLSDTGTIKKVQLQLLQKQINKELEKTRSELSNIITGNMKSISGAVVKDAKNFAGTIGLKAKDGAYGHVADDVVRRVSNGELYQPGWTLSKALWKDEAAMRQEIQNMVAKGMAENKSAFEIAKDLEKYVDPKAAKPWDWGKVYPGSRQKIDYNAQRLSRTMTHHAYQQSTQEVVKDNPFVGKIRWLTSTESARICDLCRSRNNKLFEKGSVPLDHPNGLCTLAPEVEKSMEDIARELKAWANTPDGTNPGIDKYAESLGYKPGEKGNNISGDGALSEVPNKMMPNDTQLHKIPNGAQSIIGQDWLKTTGKHLEFENEKERLEYLQKLGFKDNFDDYGVNDSILDYTKDAEAARQIRLGQTNPEALKEFLGKNHIDTYATRLTEADYLERYIAAEKKFDGKIYRGIAIDEKDLSKFKVGEKFDLEGLSSWSSEKDVAEYFSGIKGTRFGRNPLDVSGKRNVVFEMTNKSGVSVQGFSANQGIKDVAEVLLPNKADIVVEDVIIKGNKTTIKLKEVGQDLSKAVPKVAKVPKRIVAGEDLKHMDHDQILDYMKARDLDLEQYDLLPQTWTSKLNIDADMFTRGEGWGTREWNGSITLAGDDPQPTTILHELLHGRSKGLGDVDEKIAIRAYGDHTALEEGVVQSLTMAIGRKEGLSLGPVSYAKYTDKLDEIKHIVAPDMDDVEFYSNLLKTPLRQRSSYLKGELNNTLIGPGLPTTQMDVGEMYPELFEGDKVAKALYSKVRVAEMKINTLFSDMGVSLFE